MPHIDRSHCLLLSSKTLSLQWWRHLKTSKLKRMELGHIILNPSNLLSLLILCLLTSHNYWDYTLTKNNYAEISYFNNSYNFSHSLNTTTTFLSTFRKCFLFFFFNVKKLRGISDLCNKSYLVLCYCRLASIPFKLMSWEQHKGSETAFMQHAWF